MGLSVVNWDCLLSIGIVSLDFQLQMSIGILNGIVRCQFGFKMGLSSVN